MLEGYTIKKKSFYLQFTNSIVPTQFFMYARYESRSERTVAQRGLVDEIITICELQDCIPSNLCVCDLSDVCNQQQQQAVRQHNIKIKISYFLARNHNILWSHQMVH